MCNTATYDFLTIEDATKDKVLDVLFARKDSVGSLNITCEGNVESYFTHLPVKVRSFVQILNKS